MASDLRKQQALEYHAKGRPGKIEVVPTKEAKPNEIFRWLIRPALLLPAWKLQQILMMYINTPLKEI